MKKAVYTVVIDDYDVVKPPLYKNRFWTYIVLKYNHNISDFNGWDEVIDISDYDNLGSRILSRKPKILPHIYLPEYNYTIYHDANIQINYNPDKLLGYFKKFDITLNIHPKRDCVYEECKRCINVNKDKIENINKIEKFLIDNQFPKNKGLTGNGILLRWNNKKVERLMEYWWQFIVNYSYRDQLSFIYAKEQYPDLKIKIIKSFLDKKHKYFIKHNHYSNK